MVIVLNNDIRNASEDRDKTGKSLGNNRKFQNNIYIGETRRFVVDRESIKRRQLLARRDRARQGGRQIRLS